MQAGHWHDSTRDLLKQRPDDRLVNEINAAYAAVLRGASKMMFGRLVQGAIACNLPI